MKKIVLSNIELLHFQQLDERQRRLFAALKAIELGYYGVAMVCEAYNINRKTVYRGKAELAANNGESSKYIRQSGGKKKERAYRERKDNIS